MRPLDQIVRRNARREIDRHIEKLGESGYQVTEFTIAGRMAVTLGKEHRSVHRQLKRYLYEDHTWRVDYIDALAVALGIAPLVLVNLDLTSAPPELTVAGSLYRGLNDRLTVAQSRDLVSALHGLLDDLALFQVSEKLTEILLTSPSHDEALRRITELMVAPTTRAAWTEKHPASSFGKRLKGRPKQ